MTDTFELEQDIVLHGKSGESYRGKIYADKKSASSDPSPVIVCLSNSQWVQDAWQHKVKDIYDGSSEEALEHFRERDDISHIILIPKPSVNDSQVDVIDDLRRRYIHG